MTPNEPTLPRNPTISPFSILLALIAAVLIAGAVLFNRLVARDQLAQNGGINMQLKRRADLIPQLVKTVRGYAAHEQALLEDISAKRSDAVAAQARILTECAKPLMSHPSSGR